MHQKSIHLNRGFTLIELMVTIAVLAIILGFAIPSFTDQIRNNRSLTFGEEFATALNFARSEAVKRGGLVSVCASNDGGTDCGDDWSNGWLAFVDEAAEASANAASVGLILRYWDPAPNDMVMEVTRDDSDIDFVRFAAMGTLGRVGNSTDPVEVTAKHDECTGNSARSLRVGVAGSVHLQRIDC